MNRWTTFAMAALCALTSACSTDTKTVRAEPPSLQVETLALDGNRVEIGVLVHNRNDHPIVVTGARLAMRIGEDTLFEDDWPLDIDIGPRVRERIRLDTAADRALARRLSEMSGESRAGIGYRLIGELRLDRLGESERELQGYLHPVPGHPGQFR